MAAKAELKAEQDKIVKLQAFNPIYLHGKNSFADDSSQNTFVYQSTIDMLELKEDKATVYVIGWKSKGLFRSKPRPFHSAYFRQESMRYFGYKIGIQFNNTPLVVEVNNYTPKTAKAYIVYDLDNCPKTPLRNFTLKNCLFGATNMVRNSDKKSMFIVAME